jgi:Site-specific recombinases, DNA invertase Pin homologs
MQVAGYVRVSTEEQRAEGSHENQRDKLQTWAERRDHDIEIFQDIAISGKSDERPEYDAMMDRSAEFDAIAVRELSRFGRSLQRVLRDIEQLQEDDTEFISVTEDFSTDSAMGKMMMQMMGVFNEFWSNLASERATEMIERKKENNEPIGRPRKVDDALLEQIREWDEMGLTYPSIANLVEDKIGEPIDQSTIYRYCKDKS